MSDLLKHFREKQLKQSSETVMNARCPFCSMQCSMEITEERVITRNRYKVKPNKEDPTSKGRLCIKGMQAHQHAIHSERIKHPLLKIDGEFVRIPWSLAIEMIVERFTSLQDEYGKNTIGVYGGGSLTNEEAYLLGKFARVALQTKYIDYNGRFCMSAAASAANATFGIDRGLTNELTEVANAECIILAGTNIAECQPTIMPYFRKAKKNGAFIIAIDPRVTPTTKMADLHLKVRPGMDANLAIGMLKVIFAEGYLDHSFIEKNTNGFTEVEKAIQNISLEEVAKLTGVPLHEILEAARAYGKAKTGMIFTARGVEQHSTGSATVRQFLNLVLATGKVGKHACGYGAITGQGNGQGGREHGLKADQLPGYRSLENAKHRQYIASVWGVEEKELPHKGVSAYELLEKIDSQEIKALFLMGSNPVVSSPNALFVEKALKKLDFLVVVDMFVSETARMADLLLPTTSYLEDEGTMTNLEGRVVHRPAQRKRPGDTKHDWEILSLIAEGLGKGDYFHYSKAEDIFNELRIASKGGVADYSGISYQRIKGKGVFWPCPSEDHPGTPRLFEEGFATDDRRANFGEVRYQFPKEKPSTNYPLILTTGRVMEHYLSGVQTRNSYELNSRSPKAYVEVHPETAARFNVEDGEMIFLKSRRGTASAVCKITEHIREDTIFAPFHWGDLECINRITSPELDPTCRMPEFKVSAIHIEPVYSKKISKSVCQL